MNSGERYLGKYFVDINFKRRKHALAILLATYLVFVTLTFMETYPSLYSLVSSIINDLKAIITSFGLIAAGVILLLGQTDVYSVNENKIILRRRKKEVTSINIDEIESFLRPNELGDFASLGDLFGFREVFFIALLLTVGIGVSFAMYKVSPIITLTDLVGTAIICILIYIGYRKLSGKVGVQLINASIMGFVAFSFSFLYAVLNLQDTLLRILVIIIVTLLAIVAGWYISFKVPFLCQTLIIKDEKGNIIVFDAPTSSVLQKLYSELIRMVRSYEISRETRESLGAK